jgi:hypothetical protein
MTPQRAASFKALKKYERNFQKPLDKSIQICYNIYTEMRARATHYGRKGELKNELLND